MREHFKVFDERTANPPENIYRSWRLSSILFRRHPMIEFLWRGMLIGIGATVLMDLWAIVLHRVFSQPKANWAPGGRWFWHLSRGKVFHESIAAAESYHRELDLGWAGHYPSRSRFILSSMSTARAA